MPGFARLGQGCMMPPPRCGRRPAKETTTPQYLFICHGGRMPETPEEGAKSMAAWQAWMGDMGDALLEPGAPVGSSSTVKSDGSVVDDGGPDPTSGYSLVEAEDVAAAQNMAKSCPNLQAGGTNWNPSCVWRSGI